MRKKKQGKLVLLTLGLFMALAALWIGLTKAEELFAGKDSGQKEEAEAEAVYAGDPQEIKINGVDYSYDHRIRTYLLIGTDGRGNMDGEGEEYEGDIADFLLLAVLDETDGSYGFLQLDRDTMTDVNLMRKDGTWDETASLQLCLSYFYGGTPQMSCENTVNAVSALLGGIPIDGYYALSMENIPKLNHAVGGVEVTIAHDFSQVDPSMVQGDTMTLSDEQAYTFVHDRYDVGDESNAQRMKRQTQYMEAFLRKTQKLMREDPAFLNSFYLQMEDAAVTNIGGGQLSGIAGQIYEGEELGILRPEGEHRLEISEVDGEEYVTFYMEPASLAEALTKLYDLQAMGE